MTTPSRGLLFHFTHLDNLESIARRGLLADNRMPEDGFKTEVGEPSIKERRRERAVPCGPRGVVADYVPFYFAARSPMLFSIHAGNVPTYEGGQDDIVYLVSRIERIVELGLPFVFTNRNAVLGSAAFSDDIARLDDEFVDWELMRQKMWDNTAEEPDRKQRRMAEFLVHRQVPWEALLGVVAFDEARSEQASRILDSARITTNVGAISRWYFSD